MILFGREVGARLAGAVTGALVLAIAVGLAVRSCDHRSSRSAQQRVDSSQARAAADSSADAIATVDRSGRAAADSEALTRSNEQEIRNAPGADDKVNPAVRDAGRRSLCRRAAYRDHPGCKLLEPAPR